MPRTRVDDLDIVWDVAGPDSGEPVLLINGLGAPRGSWYLQVAALGERYRVYTYDNRDVGETGPGERLEAYGIDQFARDAAALIDTLAIGPVHVIGASMGGAIAQELALTRPELVRSVQIVCSWPRADPWLAALIAGWSEMFAAMGAFAWACNSWLWVFTHRWYRDPERVASLVSAAETYPYPQRAAMFDRQCQAAIAFDSRERPGEIALPVHIIAGAEDILTPPRFSEQIAAAIPGSELTILPDVGHGMFWETPDVFNDALMRFLDAHRA
ncbi:MAG: alpha/beta fold hydrolase [Chloroflexia bacterium]|nr:alpha/beta fold hydrolase [Chloroflexia bacterium]